MENTVLAEVLDKALAMEKKGQRFYKEASNESTNDVTKRMFGFLANNELLHIESIEKFYNTLKEKGEFPEVDLESMKSKRAEDLTLFARDVAEFKGKVKQRGDDVKACEFAMEFENSGYKYYENMLKKAKDEKLKKLLNFLLQEESQHYEGIMNLHTYLTDSQNWFMYEEKSFPQG